METGHGTINENSEESKIVRKLSKAYVDGNFEIAAEYMADDAVNTVNGIEYTKDEWIAGYKRDQEVFDDIQQNNLNITTMYYNNGRIFTNHWLTWYGTFLKSKTITRRNLNIYVEVLRI